MEKNKFDVPSKVLNTKKMEEELSSLHTLLTEANQAYKELKLMGDFSSQMPALSTLSYSFAEAITSKALQAIEGNASMTFEEKKEATKKWRRLQDKANSYISAISIAKEAMPLQEANGSLICPSITEIAKEKSYVQLPAEANSHYSLFNTVMQAVEELRQFEKEHDIPSLHLFDLSNYIDPDAFAHQWAFGVFTPADEATKRMRERYRHRRPSNKF